MARKAKIPTDLPADAVGFIATRPDRPERRALYGRDGVLQGSFAQDASDADIEAALATGGLRMVGGFVVLG